MSCEDGHLGRNMYIICVMLPIRLHRKILRLRPGGKGGEGERERAVRWHLGVTGVNPEDTLGSSRESHIFYLSHFKIHPSRVTMHKRMGHQGKRPMFILKWGGGKLRWEFIKQEKRKKTRTLVVLIAFLAEFLFSYFIVFFYKFPSLTDKSV